MIVVPFVAALAAYGGLAVALTWPLVLRLHDTVLNDPVDPIMSAWILWWNAHRVPFTSEWWNGLLFFPTAGVLALSDHRVGLSLMASPIQWLGGSPILAYNISLLSTFVLSAAAAHALAFALTRRHAAGLIAGLSFGFSPYRIAHIPHLEILASYGMPIALLALHRYIATDRAKWLGVFMGAFWLQAMLSGYYFFYFSVILALWMIWFIRPGEWRRLRAIALAWSIAGLAMLPVLLGYRAILQRLGLSRHIDEIEFFSADITAIWRVAPSLALWNSLPAPLHPEGELFPGMIIVFVILAAILAALLRPSSRGAFVPTPRRVRTAICGCAAVAVLVAMSAVVFGPWRLGWNQVTLLSVTKPEKPLSVAFALFALALVSGPRFRAAFRERSVFGFYLTAAVVAWMLSWGPAPRFLGRVVLYKAPYAWLMVLPGFQDGLRVPARFAMVMTLMLAVAGSLALMRLLQQARRRTVWLCTAIVGLGVAADGWVTGIPMVEAPAGWFAPETIDLRQVSAVVELPVGDLGRDAAAFYRSIHHGRPVVNGISGYIPAHYPVLQQSLDDYDLDALDPIAEHGPLLIVIHHKFDGDAAWRSYVSRIPAATLLGSTTDRAFFLLPRKSRLPHAESGREVQIRHITGNRGSINVRDLIDADPYTRWSSLTPQEGGEEVTIQLDGSHCVGAIQLSLGVYNLDFPRELTVETSEDGRTWHSAWRGRTAAMTMRAALAAPRDMRFTIPVGPVQARAIHLRQVGRDDLSPWSIAGLRVAECVP